MIAGNSTMPKPTEESQRCEPVDCIRSTGGSRCRTASTRKACGSWARDAAALRWTTARRLAFGRTGRLRSYVAADHAYSLTVVDRKWASDIWYGVILQSDSIPRRNPICSPTRLCRSRWWSRGPKHEPVKGALVIVRSFDRQHGSDGPLRTLSTDQRGRAEFAVARGQYQVYMAMDYWREHQAISVSSDEPVSVEFYRGWGDKRTFWGWLIADHRPHKPGPATVVRAWNPAKRQMAAEAAVTPRGRSRSAATHPSSTCLLLIAKIC